MNGVRRFLGSVTAQGPPLESGPSPPSTINTSPLVVAGKSLTSSDDLTSRRSDSPSIPGTAVPGLIIRKDRQKPLLSGPSQEDIGKTSTQSERSEPSISSFKYPGHNTSISSPATSSPNWFHGSLSGSPNVGLSRVPHRKSSTQSDADWTRTSGLLNTRDELLVSLLASEAVVDSREFEVLSAEEVEDLKKEQQVLSSRLGAANKKLTLETKIRDAALSLSKVNATHNRISKRTDEQLESANRRVDTAQKELWRVSESVHDVHNRLLEHRAAVLSVSVRTLEKKMAKHNTTTEGDGSGYTTPSNFSSGHSAPMSPNASSATSVSASSKTRFEGAHFFAGHADAVVPRQRRGITAEVTSLEEKLKAATDALNEANIRRGQLAQELSSIRLEKEQVVATMGMELQGAEDTIHALERELPRLEGLDSQLKDLLDERKVWERDRSSLTERTREVEALKRKLVVFEEKSGEASGMEELLAEAKENSRRELQRKDSEIRELRAQWHADRTQWERDKAIIEDAKARIAEDLEEGLLALRTLVQTHSIVLFSRDTSLPGLASSIGSHLTSAAAKVERMVKEDWESTRRKLEDEICRGNEKREALFRDLEEARREREESRRELRTMEGRLREQTPFLDAPLSPVSPITDLTGDAGKIISTLQPLWTILPSPEARAAKFAARSNFRSNSPTSPGSPKVLTSLSELDVRSLKTLYDSKVLTYPSSPNPANAFSVDAFVQRVQALIADDRALIERLIRFAQAHDLLKKNAERAQKLAQESGGALETYQKQVRTLEERNAALSSRQVALQDDIQHLQDAVDQITAEKQELDMQVNKQAEICRQLTDANTTLSAKTLTLAQEAAIAPEMVRKQLDETRKQLDECKVNLQKAEAEIDGMRKNDDQQRILLFDELNSLQTENGNLREQLRAVKA